MTLEEKENLKDMLAEKGIESSDNILEDDAQNNLSDDNIEVSEDNIQETDQEEDQDINRDEDPEAWITESSKQGGGHDQVPVSKYVKVKKNLKSKIFDHEEEIKRLREENDYLRSSYDSGIKSKQKKEVSMPSIDDYDSDEDYNTALSAYIDHKTEQSVEKRMASVRQNEQERLLEAQREIEINRHYDRANNFVRQYGIDANIYNKTDEIVRSDIEYFNPGKGDVITDRIISTLGEGSEKVMYRLGINNGERQTFTKLLRDDPTGLKAMLFLGELKTKITKPLKRVSNAPNPSPRIRGDSNIGSGGAYKKKYDEALKKGDIQKAFDLKYEAKEKKIDTGKW